MNVNVSIHLYDEDTTEVTLHHHDEGGQYAVLEMRFGAIFITSREKLLELASLLERAAQQWEGKE